MALVTKRKPRAIGPGSILRVVSPASPIEEEKMLRGLQFWKDKGYHVQIGQHSLASDSHLAGADAVRAADLMDAFQDPEVDAVYCSRGGYGCARLFPYLDLDCIAESGKLLIGFSDITTLHIALNRRGVTSLYAPMALTLAFDRQPYVYDSLWNAFSSTPLVPDTAPRPTPVVHGNAVGESVGGCLCLICDTLGTPEEIVTQGKILFIEDVDEAPHRIDAMFTHLLNAGKLQECAGIVVGEMTRTDEKADGGIGGKPWREIVSERLLRAGVPSVIDFPFGHAANMLSVPLGIRTQLDSATGQITYLETLCDAS